MRNASFLPEDYLEQKAERRTNLISLTLFAIVMVAVFAAFLVTNRQWSKAKADRAAINAQYRDKAAQIEQLNELEEQRDAMLNKAELAAALVERVPRSILLAELINRMPPRVGMLEFELKSEKVVPPRQTPKPKSIGRLRGAQRALTRSEAAKQRNKPKRIEPPRYRVSIRLVGVAPTDLEVSHYIAALNAQPLLQAVRLEYSEQKDDDDTVTMRKFAIKMTLNPDMDVSKAASTLKGRQVGPSAASRSLRSAGGGRP